MKVLHVINSMDPAKGGPCQGIRNANSESEKLGVYKEVACLDDPAADYLGSDSFRIHALGPSKAGPWEYGAKLVPWLKDNLDRFDAVIINGLWLYPSFGAWRAIRQYKQSAKKPLKTFVMPHGMLDPYFQNTPGRKLKAIRNWFYWNMMEKNVVNDADCLLFTCEEELRLATQTFDSYKPKSAINVGYGIQEPPAFQAAMRQAFYEKCPQVVDKPYLLFLSRINYKKGLDLLINAYATVRKKYATEQQEIPRLVIAGPGLDTPYGKMIEKLVQETPGLSEHVFFAGMLTGDAKWGAFYGCEAFVLPSHQENFGIAVVEAMACRKPVLITNRVNIWREIATENAGFIEDDTESGATRLLENLLTLSDDETVAMGERAYAAYQRYFSIQTSVKRMVDTMTTFC